MTYSVKVENGIVTNRIRGTADGWIETDVAQIDWRYDGTTFTPPPWDRSFAPSQWHEYDKETGEWVERTEEKAEYERDQAIQERMQTWDDRLRGKSFAELKAIYDDTTAAQKDTLLLYLMLTRAKELK